MGVILLAAVGGYGLLVALPGLLAAIKHLKQPRSRSTWFSLWATIAALLLTAQITSPSYHRGAEYYGLAEFLGALAGFISACLLLGNWVFLFAKATSDEVRGIAGAFGIYSFLWPAQAIFNIARA